MMQLAKRFMARIGTAGAVASAVLFVLPAFAQDSRLSLADRVTRLEQQAQNNGQGGTGMVNQMQQLQSQVQQLQGQVEELQHQLQQSEDKNKAQYIDLDSRLGRIEGGAQGAASGAPAASAAGAAGAVASATPPAAANSGATAAASGPVDAAGAQAAYDVAFKSIRAGDYVQASREFRAFVEQYPEHALAPNAWYWLGESYYATTNYSVALEAFQHLLAQFPASDKAPDALLKVGYSQVELKQDAAARTTLASVVSKYPGSRAAGLAQERLRRLGSAGN